MLLSSPPENLERAKQDGIVVPVRFDLPRGSYQLHVGAKDAASGRLGTVRHDISVPDFGDSRLSFSGVVLSATDVPSPPFVRKADELQAMLQPGNASSKAVCMVSLPLTALSAGTYSLRFAADAGGKRVESAPVFFNIH